MWEDVTIDRDDLLTRATELSREGDTRAKLLPFSMAVAAERSAIGEGAVRLHYYQGEGFELVMKLEYRAKHQRYLVCYAVAGNITAEDALTLLIDKTIAVMQVVGIAEVYGYQPKNLRSSLLAEVYQLATVSPRVHEELVDELADMWIYRLTFPPADP